MSRSRERGNILFLILLAVVLFAALSYAVTSSMRGGGNDASNEKDQLTASNLIEYAADIQSKLQRHMLINSLKWSQIEYNANDNNTDCNSSVCMAQDMTQGAGINYAIPESAVNPFTQTDPVYKTYQLRFIQVPGVGTDKPELGLVVFGITPGVCKAINKLMKINASYPGIESNIGSYTTVHSIYGATYSASDLERAVDGDNPKGFLLALTGTSTLSPEFAGQRSFCVCLTDANCNGNDPVNALFSTRFWTILVER